MQEARRLVLLVGLVVMALACGETPEAHIAVPQDSGTPETVAQPDATVPADIPVDGLADLAEETTLPEVLAELPPVDLPDCPFKPCSQADYPDLKPGPCEKLGWDAESCDCAIFPKATGASCDDGNQCTLFEQCDEAGECVGQERDCTDNNLCTDDSCLPDEGCIHTPNSQPCEDGNPCTADDVCSGGVCTGGTYLENCGECDPAVDTCESVWGDGDLCNGTLVCVEHECLVDPETVVLCNTDDDPPCLQDLCQPETGECVATEVANGSACDDGNLCTKEDYCLNGECKGFLNSAIEGCQCEADDDCQVLDDGDLCNGTLHCSDGICLTDAETVPEPCDKSGDLPCIKNLCVPATGKCEATQIADGEPCGANDPCAPGGTCQEGVCVSGEPLDCSDLDGPCTLGVCEIEAGGCVAAPANEGEPCDSDDACALESVCNAGQCVLSVGVDCDDGDPCTVDGCSDGECTHTPGGGAWTVTPPESSEAEALVGQPATPGQLEFALANEADGEQVLMVYESDENGTPTDWPWLALDHGRIVLEGQGEMTVAAHLYPAAANLPAGQHVAYLAVTDLCPEEAALAVYAVSVTVGDVEPTLLFAESFDDNPFLAGRWTVFMGDCTNPAPGTVNHYANAADACGDPTGYIYREYKGDRCVEYTGEPFTTTGYTGLELTYHYRLEGGSIKVATLGEENWSAQFAEAKAKDMTDWLALVTPVDGLVAGLRFFLKDGKDHIRRLDCITLTGVPACLQWPVLTQEPTNLTVAAGETATFTVTATGDNLSYRWYRENEPVADSDTVSGAFGPTLTISDCTNADDAKYHVYVTDHCGTVDSQQAELTVE